MIGFYFVLGLFAFFLSIFNAPGVQPLTVGPTPTPTVSATATSTN